MGDTAEAEDADEDFSIAIIGASAADTVSLGENALLTAGPDNKLADEALGALLIEQILRLIMG